MSRPPAPPAQVPGPPGPRLAAVAPAGARRYLPPMPLLVAVRDLVFRSKIHAAAERLGVPLTLAPRGTPLADAARALGEGTILVDLGEQGLLEQIPATKQAAKVKLIGFLGHLDADLARAANEAGVDEILSRGQFVQRLDSILKESAAAPTP